MSGVSAPPPDAPRGPLGDEPHRRRPRYAGTHPRRFDEKYKEHDPLRFPELAERLAAGGRTPAGQHLPVLRDEVLAALAPRPGERAVDGTLGFGGHTEALLAALAPGGRLLALDVDPLELPRTEARLAALGHAEPALVVRRRSFAGLPAALHELGWGDGIDALCLDLGVSSMQLDDPSRGFSLRADGPLDMRMNPRHGLPASEWLARADVATLAAVLADHADEPRAEPLARALLRPPTASTTAELAAAVRGALPPGLPEDEPALTVRRVFQALRMEVNQEPAALDAFLRQLPACLRSGGRVAIISFHSGEDRRVKAAFKQGLRDGTFAAVAPDVIVPGSRERAANPRCHSARLRWARRA